MDSEIIFLTRNDICNILHISLPTLWRRTKEGNLKSYKIGRRVLYKKHEVMEQLS